MTEHRYNNHRNSTSRSITNPDPESRYDWIVPDWPGPARVKALITTRSGGVSPAPYASLNLGTAVGDASENVAENRKRLQAHLPAAPRWLRQVHGNEAVRAETVDTPVAADASFTREAHTVCAVMVADCLPVLFCDRMGETVAAAHAGWRGLCRNVLENTVRAMNVPASDVLAYLGPAIGPDAFEVGDDVYDAFISVNKEAANAFRPHTHGKWLADLYTLARQRLQSVGVTRIYGGRDCTFSQPARFFSHRRDKVSGRMAALVWLTQH